MSTSRVILLFLAILFLVILILSGNRLSAGFSERFFSVFPNANRTEQKPSGTPTPVNTALSTTPALTAAPGQTNQQTTKGGVQGTTDAKPSTPSNQTPATGPAETTVVLLGGSFVIGYLLRRQTFGKR